MRKMDYMKNHYRRFDEWTRSLFELSDEKWQAPVGEGKWSNAAVVTHLLLWDQYFLKERYPYFKEGAEPAAYPDFQDVNDRARLKAEDITAKEEILKELLEIRQDYHRILNDLDDEKLGISFKIANHSLTLGEYFENLIQHDMHHQKQIDAVIEKK